MNPAGTKKTWIYAALLVAATAMVYANSLHGPFVFDDKYTIVGNRFIRHLWPLSIATSSPYQSSVAGRPVSAYSLALCYAVNELDVRIFHLFNIAVHIASALLLFGIVRRSLRMPRLAMRFEPHTDILAFAVTLLWALHPLQTESVTYIIQRSESISGMFYLATVYFFIRSVDSSGSIWWAVLAVIACTLAMGAKEIAITAPFLILFYDRIMVAGSWGEVRRRWPVHAALAATWIVLYLCIRGGPRSDTAGFSLLGLTPLVYAKTEFGVILHYLLLTVFPRTLVIDYGWRFAEHPLDWIPQMLIVLLFLMLTTYALWRRPAIGFVCAAFFILLSPTSTFIPINDAAFEHRMYLPLAPLCVLIVLGGYWLLERAMQRGPELPRAAGICGVGMLAMACAALAARTMVRNRDYASVGSLWEATLRANPTNERVYVSLANDLLQQQRYAEAQEMYQRAINLASEYFAPRYGMGSALMQEGRYEEALRYADQAFQSNLIFPEASLLRGIILTKLGRLDEAETCFKRCLEISPQHAEANFNLACIYDKKGRDAEAERHYLAALQVTPDHADACKQLADLYVRNAQPEAAIEWYQRHLRLAEPNVQELNRLATALSQANRLGEAVPYFEQAIRLSPKQAPLRFNLGNTLARLGRRDEAIAAYREALRINPEFKPAKDALSRIGATSQPH